MTALTRLEALGLELPAVPPPAAAYVPWSRVGDLVFTAGQLPVTSDGLVATGLVGRDVTLEVAQEAARVAGLNVLAIGNAAGGSLDGLKIVKLTVFVASADGFTDQHLVANGASGLLSEVLGDDGVHARSAVGVASLPLNAPVEVEAILKVP